MTLWLKLDAISFCGSQQKQVHLPQLVREGVVFERLLVGQTQRKAFIIHNTSLLPIKWQLAGADVLPPEFKVLPSSGEVPPRQEISVTVEFTAIQKKELSEKVVLKVSQQHIYPVSAETLRATRLS